MGAVSGGAGICFLGAISPLVCLVPAKPFARKSTEVESSVSEHMQMFSPQPKTEIEMPRL